MRALPTGGSYTDLLNLAVLHYDGAADANPTTDPTTNIPTSSNPLVETNLHVRNLRLVTLYGHETDGVSSPLCLPLWYVILGHLILS
jgi:hypothetical protein